ncbi:hypothetical protein ACIA8K_08050 [Catenuloplanes sp. NPDC051500]|uniref:hypothetical protein n=1 Tax=Catenuloplanes sp. NPDC051500 TaxID=3363959 RepID=UPI00379427CD
MPDIDLDRPSTLRETRPATTTRVTLLIALSLLAGYLPPFGQPARPASGHPVSGPIRACGDSDGLPARPIAPRPLEPGERRSFVVLDSATGEAICGG